MNEFKMLLNDYLPNNIVIKSKTNPIFIEKKKERKVYKELPNTKKIHNGIISFSTGSNNEKLDISGLKTKLNLK